MSAQIIIEKTLTIEELIENNTPHSHGDKVPIHDGKGRKVVRTFPNCDNFLIIDEPDEGTWTIIGYGNDWKIELFRHGNVKKGKGVMVSHHTENVELEFLWSENKDTNLKFGIIGIS